MSEGPDKGVPRLRQSSIRVAPGDERNAIISAAQGNHALWRADPQFTPTFGGLFVGKGQLAIDHAELEGEAVSGKQRVDSVKRRETAGSEGNCLFHPHRRSSPSS